MNNPKWLHVGLLLAGFFVFALYGIYLTSGDQFTITTSGALAAPHCWQRPPGAPGSCCPRHDRCASPDDYDAPVPKPNDGSFQCSVNSNGQHCVNFVGTAQAPWCVECSSGYEACGDWSGCIPSQPSGTTCTFTGVSRLNRGRTDGMSCSTGGSQNPQLQPLGPGQLQEDLQFCGSKKCKQGEICVNNECRQSFGQPSQPTLQLQLQNR